MLKCLPTYRQGLGSISNTHAHAHVRARAQMISSHRFYYPPLIEAAGIQEHTARQGQPECQCWPPWLRSSTAASNWTLPLEEGPKRKQDVEVSLGS